MWLKGVGVDIDMINIHASYFSIGNPFQVLDRWLNPPRHTRSVTLRNHPLKVEWTQRAESELVGRGRPLVIEMQLYFSCVIKKRVLFHDSYEKNTIPVSDHIVIDFRPVESESCDPWEFAKNFPVKQEFKTMAAVKMHPKSLLVDYKSGKWIGEFNI